MNDLKTEMQKFIAKQNAFGNDFSKITQDKDGSIRFESIQEPKEKTEEKK